MVNIFNLILPLILAPLLLGIINKTKAFFAGIAFNRQLSFRSGQSLQHREWVSNSPGMKKPSLRGVLSKIRIMGQISLLSYDHCRRPPETPGQPAFVSIFNGI